MPELRPAVSIGMIRPVILQSKAWGQWDTLRGSCVGRAVQGVLRDEAEEVG